MKHIVLSKARKEMVREWLDYRNGSDCPFDLEDYEPHYLCQSWFPKLTTDKDGDMCCPCHHYALSTVRRRAREMIKFNGKKDGE